MKLIVKTHFDQYKTFSDAKKKLGNKYDTINVFVKTCNYDTWFENDTELTDTKAKSDLSPMPPLEDDEEVKKEKD